jgi:hypothetical protein
MPGSADHHMGCFIQSVLCTLFVTVVSAAHHSSGYVRNAAFILPIEHAETQINEA